MKHFLSLLAWIVVMSFQLSCQAQSPLQVQTQAQSLVQDYPNKAVKLVVTYPPGGGPDVTARIVGQKLAQIWKQPVLIENKPGAGGNLGAEQVVRSAADGYTLLLASQNVPVTRRYLSKGEPIDATKDLTPISALWRTSLLLAVNPNVPAKNFKEFLEYLKLNSGKVSFSTTGIGTQGHFAGASLSAVTGSNIMHVPYNDNRVITDVISGQVPMTLSIVSNVNAHVRAGRLRLIASAGTKRLEAYPDIALITEFFPNFEPPPTWTGLFAPSGLPKPILQRLHAAILKGLSNAELKAKASSDGFDFIGNTPDEFVALINHDVEVAGRLVKLAKIEATD